MCHKMTKTKNNGSKNTTNGKSKNTRGKGVYFAKIQK